MKKMLRAWAGRTVLGAVLAAGVVGGLSAATAASAAAAENGTVYVVHGVPGLTVDVYVNGKAALTGFKPGQVAGPLSLAPGSYDVAVRKAGEAATAAPAPGPARTEPLRKRTPVPPRKGRPGPPARP